MRYLDQPLPGQPLRHGGLELNGIPRPLAEALKVYGAGDEDGAPVTVIGHALCGETPEEAHWQALAALRGAREQGARTLVLLQDTGGDFHGGQASGWMGGLAGLARTARLEWPDCDIRLVDLAYGALGAEDAAMALLRGLATDHRDVGVADPETCVRVELAARPSPGSAPSRAPGSDTLWLVSGGARGVTSDSVLALAQAYGGRFILLGRSKPTPWPEGVPHCEDLKALRRHLAGIAAQAGQAPRPAQIDRQARAALAGAEIETTLARLHALGVSATYQPCDLADRAAVHATLADMQAQFGPVTGLVHGAGVLADQPIMEKTRDAFDRVFAAKVGGLANLLAALDRNALSHIAFFSSAAAAFGNPGQADYAMANEVLNRQAQVLAAENPCRVVKAFNWGPWDGGMVDETLARAFSERGLSLIPRAAGAALFAAEMADGSDQDVEIVIGERWDR